MFRRMAGTDNGPPRLPADAQAITVLNTDKRARHPGDRLGVATAPGLGRRHHFGIKTGAVIKTPGSGAERLIRIQTQHTGLSPFLARHPQGHPEAPRQPTGKPHMIGMEMGDDHPFQGLGLGEMGVEDGLPGGLDLVAGNSGVDNGPAFAVLVAIIQ